MTPLTKRIGVLGAGQLGRMLAIAGYPLGHKFGFYGVSHEEPSAMLGHMYAHSDDAQSIEALLNFAQVLTFESENTSVDLVNRLSRVCPVYPSAHSLSVTQNRVREKRMFAQLDIPCADCAPVVCLDSLKQAIARIGLPAVLKTQEQGYDGKGQFVLREAKDAEQAWASLGGQACVLEKFVSFTRELSMIAVRNAQGQQVYYPLVENTHRQGILRVTRAPAQGIDAKLQAVAEGYMQKLLDGLEHVGVLTLELFDTPEGLLANEMAPRVHNSGHWTIEGAQTCQFENHIRAITGMPLGSTQALQPFIAMVNIIGQTGPVEQVLAMPNAHLHLYDKAERKGRKLGHITLLAQTQEDLERDLQVLSVFQHTD
jgi:5-(carboxyamino)imidazole ribonucleotide synthase